ncbi:hypothetical protein UFOVP1662_2 [uncultured Caudovirales phage]|uniref:Uncharacterized protein n=1 Tax=uncultured Caudovirales phage TaxID=2100421 RepID=A0A6J5T7S8_9CAUD|nr:hypothetical protein UFOVP883_3 [uncultured Caudovirales phage]CAB4180005.1 hypothetical protein UFOVP1050_2 [uncultured Caudovirales phage]CAB4181127.1 hypothetical protein UFOVP1059_18 [uncultured Caudovirales phage]CAB4194927.1 hypothetical protein UFOVP1274_13 [uncultured Caudovirales phage]CAB4222914.1 hypothetical protein UFOVP1662_2 [uncultured Caudovirales phage]
MATSPNYGWPEPNDSDYVKNGALAIRTLGNAIDTTVYGINVITTASAASIVTIQGQIVTINTTINGLINPFLLMGA